MLRSMLRDLRAHKGRVAMTLTAIVLGVGFVVATWVVSESTARTVTGVDARTDFAIAAQARDSAAGISPADRDRLATIPGATGASGVVVGSAQLIRRDGKVAPGEWVERSGTDWDGSTRFKLTAGRGPAKAGEVAVQESAARDAGLAVGDTARVMLAEGRSDSAVVVGLFTYRSLGFLDQTPSVAFDEATALRLLAATFDHVEVTAAPGTDADALAVAARKLGSEAFTVSTAGEMVKEARNDAYRVAEDIRLMLLSFAAVALLVGMFVIANTFTMLVTQRTRQFALLRAVGATRRQVRRAIVVEAAVLGLVGATLGCVIGTGLALLALTVLRPAGETVVYAVPPTGIVAGYVVGVVITVLAAYGSARRAAAVPPVAALRTDAALPRRAYVLRSVLGLIAIALGGAAVAVTAGQKLTNADRALGMSGALLAWLGVLLLAPLLVSAVLRPLAAVFSRGGAVSRLALRNAVRDPRRTAATASALMIGLALVCAFATVGETFIWHITSATRAVISATTTVVTPAAFGASLDPGLVAKLKAVPGVTTAVAVSEGYAQLNQDEGVRVMSVEPAGIGTVLHPKIISGSADLRRGVVIASDHARRLRLGPGDRVTLSVDQASPRELTIAGVYDRSELGPLGDVLVDPASAPAEARERITGMYITGGDPASVRRAVDAALRDRPDILVTDRDGMIAELVDEVRLALSILYALLGAAVVIAVFGVVNTLALSVVERTREIGVFRAVGATRRLVRRSVRLESVIIATYGGLLGVGVGLALGGVMQHLSFGRPLWDIAIPYLVVGSALTGMVLVGVLAAVWPARRAARTDILGAIATE